MTSIGIGVFSGCSSLASMTVAEGNATYHSAGNCIVETSSKKLVAGCKASVIPEGGSVTSIGDYAFSYCSSLASIVIPLSVTSIGDSAFNEYSKLSIFAEAASLPSGWNAGYNPTPCPVYWYSEAKNTDGSHWHYVSDVPTLWAK